MDRERAAPKGRAYRNPRSRMCMILGVVIANLAVGGLVLYGVRMKMSHANPAVAKQRLLAERAALVRKMDKWNAKARDSTAAMGLPQLVLAGDGEGVDSAVASGAGSVRLATRDSLRGRSAAAATAAAKLVGGSSATGAAGAAARNGGVCDAPDPDPKFRMRPAHEVESENPELAAKLRQHAKNGEIMLALANAVMICKNSTICWWNGGNILESFLTILKRTNVTNHLIGVMDDETEKYLTGRPGVNWFRVNIQIPESQAKTHPANRVSTIKYTLLKDFLQMGYNVLITDMDLVYISNPFDHLHRDADIEVQTDGFDDTAYGVLDGVQDPTMGWGGGGLFFKTFTTNVGCMWVKANARSYKLMVQVSDQLTASSGWDQQVFNQWLMPPSHGAHQSAYAHLRVMDYMKFVNSKIFFRSRRSEYIPGKSAKAPTPVMVHFNYHPDKHKRMLCIMDRYYYGKVDACDKFPGGSEPNT